MPYIEEKNLLALHKQIEREQAANNKLLDQIHAKGKSINRNVRLRNIAWGICVLMIVSVLAIFFYWNSMMDEVKEKYASCLEENLTFEEEQERMATLEQVIVFKEEINDLQTENHILKEELMLGDEVVYSVQVRAFKQNNIPLRSERANYIYAQTLHGLYAFSVGVFKTKKEAYDLQKALIWMGFEDAFVASYQEGKRIRIENE